jgi:C-terminal processing protease CtpA/Prc
VLSKDTILFTLPTFNDRYAALVRKLLADQRGELASHPNWIIDVRNNGGGSDGTYAPLMGWLLDGDLPRHSVEFFVTPANLKAQEELCPMTADPAACAQSLAPVLQAMRTAAPGSYVLKGSQRMVFEPVKLEPKRPARVAVLIDHDCGSSCEQFVLEARTGFRVKLVGRPTYGALDDSNLRPHPLPSGRVLYYATTRSTRVPDMRIDGIGIPPDILLPRPKDAAGREAEVLQVQRWLEGGPLSGK